MHDSTFAMNNVDQRRWALISVIVLTQWLLFATQASAQLPNCDPSLVLGSETCVKCHGPELAVWRQTPHFKTFEQLHRDPRAKEISKNMGQLSIKRGNLCIQCHYTQRTEGDKTRVISGVSCESCHGAAKDWIALHNDYGGPTATRESESTEHQRQRYEASVAAGMRNPKNLYLVAQSCLACHTVPNEKLVNEGTHLSGSDQFELVAWSQGSLRHNFVRSAGKENEVSSPERLRVMYVVGQIADLEFSTRATGLATTKGTYGFTVANRAATVAVRLYEIQQKLNDPLLEKILIEFSKAELKINNQEQLNRIADSIHSWGIEFAETADGLTMTAIDSELPDPATWR